MRAAREGRAIVLYQPRDIGRLMPLGLLSLGSSLGGENVVVVDGRLELAPEARVSELARDACCLGVTVRTGRPLRDALRISAAARAANPRLHVLWGGAHASAAPESCLGTGIVDGCVRGAGEEAVVAAVRAIRSGRALDTIPGLVVQGGVVPRPAQPSPADRLPRAMYSLLDLERYFEAKGARRLDYCSSRGARDGGCWSALPAGRVVEELAELTERHRLSEVAFRDEDFFADAARAEAIVAGLAGLGRPVQWRAAARIGDLLEAGHERLLRLAAGRCRMLHVRVPPGVPARGGVRSQVLEAAASLHAAGLAACFELLVAEPGARMEGLKAVVSLARRLCALDARFETPIRRMLDVPSEGSSCGGDGAASLEVWAAREDSPWLDARAERRLARASFYFSEAQRPAGRRLGQHVLRTLALLRVRLGFFALDFDRLAVEASAVVRTGRSHARVRAD